MLSGFLYGWAMSGDWRAGGKGDWDASLLFSLPAWIWLSSGWAALSNTFLGVGQFPPAAGAGALQDPVSVSHVAPVGPGIGRLPLIAIPHPLYHPCSFSSPPSLL